MKHVFVTPIKFFCFLSILATFFVSCTKYNNPAPVYQQYAIASDSTTKRKVLLITIDGLVSTELKQINPATIASLLPNSKYTYNGLSEQNTTDAPTATSIATGVHLEKHRVLDSSFLPTAQSSGTASTYYPSFFYRILQNQPQNKTVSITSWAQLNRTLLIHATDQVTPKTDAAVKDSTIGRLARSNEAIISANFREVESTGIAYGFVASVPQYAAAVKRIDGYIGEIIAALKARPTYTKENWLVIITSNHGATPIGFGGSSGAERQIFTLFYNAKYKQLELTGNTISSVNLSSVPTRTPTGVGATITDSAGNYNFNGTGMTIMFKIKANVNSAGSTEFNYPKFFGKNLPFVGELVGCFTTNVKVLVLHIIMDLRSLSMKREPDTI